MLTAMQMKYFKEDFNAILWKVVEREHMLGIDTSVTTTSIMTDPTRVSFTFDAIFEKKNKKGEKNV